MEERNINESESLELITMMIKNARTNLRAKINCNIMLVWGYVTAITSILVWGVKRYTEIPYSSLLWLLIPLICYPVTRYLSSKDHIKVKSYIDKTIDHITILNIIVCLIIGISAIWVSLPVLFIEGILFNMWATIVGLLIRYKPVIWGGIIGIAFSYSLLYIPEETRILIFAAIPIFSIIIPGHLFKKSIPADV